nr:MAG TPA: hypothetical protein [Caudoviricetes sp.]
MVTKTIKFRRKGGIVENKRGKEQRFLSVPAMVTG